MYTYKLTDGGFLIYIDDELYYTQDCRPGVPGFELMEPAEAEAMAKLLVAEWTARDFNPYTADPAPAPVPVAAE